MAGWLSSAGVRRLVSGVWCLVSGVLIMYTARFFSFSFHMHNLSPPAQLSSLLFSKKGKRTLPCVCVCVCVCVKAMGFNSM